MSFNSDGSESFSCLCEAGWTDTYCSTSTTKVSNSTEIVNFWQAEKSESPGSEITVSFELILKTTPRKQNLVLQIDLLTQNNDTCQLLYSVTANATVSHILYCLESGSLVYGTLEDIRLSNDSFTLVSTSILGNNILSKITSGESSYDLLTSEQPIAEVISVMIHPYFENVIRDLKIDDQHVTFNLEPSPDLNISYLTFEGGDIKVRSLDQASSATCFQDASLSCNSGTCKTWSKNFIPPGRDILLAQNFNTSDETETRCFCEGPYTGRTCSKMLTKARFGGHNFDGTSSYSTFYINSQNITEFEINLVLKIDDENADGLLLFIGDDSIRDFGLLLLELSDSKLKLRVGESTKTLGHGLISNRNPHFIRVSLKNGLRVIIDEYTVLEDDSSFVSAIGRS